MFSLRHLGPILSTFVALTIGCVGQMPDGSDSSDSNDNQDDTPSDDNPADDTPSDDTPSDDTPSDDTPSDDTPSDDTPSDDTPSDDTPSDDTPSDDEPSDDEPSDDTPSDDTPSDDTPSDDGPSDDGPSDGGDGLGPWNGHDNVPASPNPPFGLSPSEVPQFVAFGWDDNAYSGLEGSAGDGGFSWSVNMAKGKKNKDGSPIKFSYYMTAIYIGVWQSESPTFVKRAWRQALEDGHEIGNHTYNHAHGDQFPISQWMTEIESATNWLKKPFDPNEVNFSPDDSKGIGMDGSKIYGFRTPFLEYNDATLSTVDSLGFRYDCSIEDGWHWEQDGTDFMWPYTLDNGSAGHDVLVEWGSKAPITPHPGLWELPIHPVIIPPDSVAAQYGIAPGLRNKIKSKLSWFDTEGGKITGFDYNLWYSAELTKAEFLATLKYTFDLRYNGNRAPLMLGVHTDYYSSKWPGKPQASPADRRAAIEEFIAYVTSKQDARIVPNAEILNWVRNPVPLP